MASKRTTSPTQHKRFCQLHHHYDAWNTCTNQDSRQYDPLSVTTPNLYPNEERFQTIGAALSGILFVVHTIKELSDGNELYWIISARYATSAERKAYEES